MRIERKIANTAVSRLSYVTAAEYDTATLIDYRARLLSSGIAPIYSIL